MKTTFKNIAGYKQEKEEALNLCKMLNNYDDYKSLGVTLPKGLLLYGKPGVGKTLFAKAISSEINRNFVEVGIINPSDENFSNILKEKFELAKTKAPAVLFIDEIDKMVPIDSHPFRPGFNSDKSRGVLTLLLTLLDGFSINDNVLVICTTNSLSTMPEALTRTGRIDKHIKLDLPDDDSRRAIANMYLSKIKLNKDINIDQIVLSSGGFSCSDIQCAINESAISAINQNKASITTIDVLEHLNRIENKSLSKQLNASDSEITAYHELGHFIVANTLKKIIKDISIIKTPKSLGRVKIKIENDCYSTEDLLNDVTIALAGRAAEEHFLHKKYAGSYGDIEAAYRTLSAMVSHGDFGYEYLCLSTNPMMMSEQLPENAQLKVKELMEDCLIKAKKIIQEKEDIIEMLKPRLIEAKILSSLDLEKDFEGEIVKDEKKDNDNMRSHIIEIFDDED